ncbi:hypothetical protein EV643_122126 [Kribbella sp. VKM Ac-2527]|uniref:Tfp pilus assembly protein PilX n=1 Tax=Kribbella caucasensis TaxID=2512215 RepID=A0A4R6JM76_9ACTN|nr:hypothetical protein [Kribbella sp. VKM Ac-2527]TDO35715.1 hypothetical protein EV643_122126 [Kribbella sp. VKM Ac-2527]
MTNRLRRARDEDGAALVLVLIVITVAALGISALLTRADTGVRATVGLRDQAAATYVADGAMQAAINNLRNSDYNHTTGQHCFGSADTLELKNFVGNDSAAVTCNADPNKVLIQCPSLSNCNRPGNAILTLGKVSGEDGLNIQQPTGSTFRVRGNIFSNSNINVVNGTLNTNARIWARTSCAGSMQSTPGPSCNYGSTPNVLGDDPGYVPAATTVPEHRSLPACTTQNSVVTFQPGYYDDAVGLSKMMSGSSACRHSTWWFKPGTYYFDFHNDGDGANPVLPSGSNVWSVDDGYLVAGRPVDGAGNVIASPPVPATIPGSCQNPIKTASAVGVQFIFGGDSRLEVKAGQAEICGTYSVDKPPVAVYGLSSGAETPTTFTAKPTSIPSQGGYNPTATVAALEDVGGTAASWKSNKKNDSTVLRLRGFAPPSAIPVGSVLQSAVVEVTHRHTDVATKDSFSARLTTGSGDDVTGTSSGQFGSPTTYQTESIPLDVSDENGLSQAVYDGTYSEATINLTTNLVEKDDTEYLDRVRLVLTYRAPAFRAGSGCVTNTPYMGVGSDDTCAMVSTVNNSGNQFYVQGTTYAPSAAIDVTLNNAAEQVFRFGVVARSLWVKETGSFSYTGVVIEVPDDSPGFVFTLYLNVYLCQGASTCTPGGAPTLTSRVALVDSDPTIPDPGRRQVTVLSWSRPG